MRMRDELLRAELRSLELEGVPALRYADRRALDEGRVEEVLATLRERAWRGALARGAFTAVFALSAVFFFVAPSAVERWMTVAAGCVQLGFAVLSAALLGSSSTQARAAVEELESLAREQRAA